MNPKRSAKRQHEGFLDIEEVQLISDLRIMHSKSKNSMELWRT
jgi:hypothetical protein